MSTRTVDWGGAFGLAVSRFGGMPAVAQRLEQVFGALAASRQSLDKLKKMSPEDMDDAERWRAYQVLLVIGEDPAEWGITEPGVPPSLVAWTAAMIRGEQDPTVPGGPTSRTRRGKGTRTAWTRSLSRSTRPDLRERPRVAA